MLILTFYPYRITLSALASTLGGIVGPICLAVFKLIRSVLLTEPVGASRKAKDLAEPNSAKPMGSSPVLFLGSVRSAQISRAKNVPLPPYRAEGKNLLKWRVKLYSGFNRAQRSDRDE
jgi:hypothetical protein